MLPVDEDVEAAAGEGERHDQTGRPLGHERGGVRGRARAQDVERRVGGSTSVPAARTMGKTSARAADHSCSGASLAAAPLDSGAG